MRRLYSRHGRAGTAFGVAMAMCMAVPTLAVIIPGDPADGRIRAGVVSTSLVEIGVGHYDDTNTPPTVGSTAILFFELPPQAAVGTVHNAAILFSLNDKSGSFTTNPANADVWGLGYVVTPTIDTNWFLAGNSDTRTGNDLGTGIGTNPVVRIADNIMSPDTFDPPNTNSPSRLSVVDPALSDFLNLVYAQGAVSGNYAVVRMSIDESASLSNRHYDVAAADDPDAARRPELRMNENTALLWDPFDDGSRLDDADPFDTSWFTVVAGAGLTITNDSGGIGSGNALNVMMDGAKNRFLGSFPAITLSNPGDFIQLTMTFRPTLLIVTSDGVEHFRFAIGNSQGSPLGGDTTSTTGLERYLGYMFRTSLDPADDIGLHQLTGDAFLGGTTDSLSSDDNAIAITDTEIFTLLFNVTRASATQMTTRVVLNDAVLIGADPGTDPNTNIAYNAWEFEDTFDAIIWGCNPDDGVHFVADNILVESSVSIFDILSHTDVVADVVEMMFETQSGTRHTLEEATDLAAANWGDSGYTVTGDGGVMPVFDPDAVEADKAYRLANEPAEVVVLFTENLDAFTSIVDTGSGSAFYGADIIPEVSSPFNDGNALRMYDFYPFDKPELQGDFASAIFGPFLVEFQSFDQSVSTNTSAIRFRLANGGASISSANRSALSLSWQANGFLTASYETVTNTTSSIASSTNLVGVHDITLVGNGFTNLTYSYTLFAQSRTLAPLAYDVYIDGVLLNNAVDFPLLPTNGLPFSVVAATEYIPAFGIGRFGLTGSSNADVDPDVVFDNIIVTIGVIPESSPFTLVQTGSEPGFSFQSASNVVYALQSSTNATDQFPIWDHSGMEVRGDGSVQVLFDAQGYSAGKSYRVVELE